MEEYLSLDHKKKDHIIKKIKDIFLNNKDIVFVYIFGSFLDSPSFRDIDIGIYIDTEKTKKKKEIFVSDDELELSKKIATICNLPSDIIEIHTLNQAPDYFLNNIFCNGRLLYSKDEKFLSELIEKVSLRALANEYISNQSLRELVSS